MGRVALGTVHRKTGYRDCLAPPRIPFVLDMEGPALTTRAPTCLPGNPETDSENEPRQSDLGRPSHSRRTAQTWHRHRRDQREQVHGPPSESALADMANVPGKPSEVDGIHRLFHGAHRSVPGALRVPGSGA